MRECRSKASQGVHKKASVTAGSTREGVHRGRLSGVGMDYRDDNGSSIEQREKREGRVGGRVSQPTVPQDLGT